jgi:hypothetical protein
MGEVTQCSTHGSTLLCTAFISGFRGAFYRATLRGCLHPGQAATGFQFSNSQFRTRVRPLAARCARAIRASFASKIRGRRECRAPSAPRSRVCSVESTRVSHHGHTGNRPAFPAQWFTAYFVLSPVTGLFCHRHQRNRFRQFDASVGASGPHDFAVRKPAPSSLAPPASTASRPASVTIASRPSVGRDGGGYIADLGPGASENFGNSEERQPKLDTTGLHFVNRGL